MARVVTFEFEGITVRLASMTWAQAETFVEQGQALIARGDAVETREWVDRTLQTVAVSLGLAGGDMTPGPEELKKAYDMPTINAMFLKVLEISGLRTSAGEAGATRTSAISAPPSLIVQAGPSISVTSPTSVA